MRIMGVKYLFVKTAACLTPLSNEVPVFAQAVVESGSDPNSGSSLQARQQRSADWALTPIQRLAQTTCIWCFSMHLLSLN